MRQTITAIALVSALAACGDGPTASDTNEPGILSALAGRWTGAIEQAGFEGYAITVDIDGNAALNTAFATVTYPDQSCSGVWTATARTSSTQYRVHEHITTQPTPPTCVTDVEIVISYTASPRFLEVGIYTNGALIGVGSLQPEATQ